MSSLSVESSPFGTLLFDLAVQNSALYRNLRRGGAFRRPEAGDRIGVLAQGRPEPRDVELGAREVALKVLQLGFIHGGVEFDQNVAGLDALAITNPDGTHHAGSKGWMTLVRPVGMIFPDAEPTMSIWPNDAQTIARHNSAMMVPPIAPANGGTGVSTISRAAGRNASSYLRRSFGERKKRNCGLSELHGCRPAFDRATRNAHRC